VVPAINLYLRKQVWCGPIPTIFRRENGARHYSSRHSFGISSHNPPLYTTAAIELLTTPTHTYPLLSSANMSPPVHRTAHNPLSRITPAPPLCHPDYAHAPRKTKKKVPKVTYILWSLPDRTSHQRTPSYWSTLTS
jgi:hypothetical protein